MLMLAPGLTTASPVEDKLTVPPAVIRSSTVRLICVAARASSALWVKSGDPTRASTLRVCCASGPVRSVGLSATFSPPTCTSIRLRETGTLTPLMPETSMLAPASITMRPVPTGLIASGELSA